VDVSLSGCAGLLWAQTFQALRSDLEDYDLSRVIWWHWCRYYGGGRRGEARHGPLGEHYDDVSVLAHSLDWARRPDGESMLGEGGRPLPGVTLSELNRAASRALYRLARDLGWRKLTRRERARLGIHGGQWVREAVYAAAQARLHDDFDSASDASSRAAGGLGLGLDEFKIEVCRRA